MVSTHSETNLNKGLTRQYKKFAIAKVPHFADEFVQDVSSVLFLKCSAKNSPPSQTPVTAIPRRQRIFKPQGQKQTE